MPRTDRHPSSDDLAAWIDARLTMWEGAQIGLHLAGCVACRQLVAEVRGTLALMEKAEARTTK